MEILGGLIRKNTKIKGISVNNKEYRISQYADDTDFILDGRSVSFEETIDTLNIFAELSGLNINYDKSEVIWIGSCRNSSVRYLQDLVMKQKKLWYIYFGNVKLFRTFGLIMLIG